ncbi:hypothetical protein GOB85_13940 [Acetobacter sp. LMG 1636]|uniref:Transposase n=1 Tax=Acetobacter fallax TaxID=1737473 RepID=A0ABX0KB28_9PROT|nr:hypothetical protein [Acetobacter fallax]NHO37191.1 hypothetical protein [Acetobacter fallax]
MLAADAVLCTDTAAVYARIAREAGIHHEAVNPAAGERVRDHAFHIQNVNASHSRFRDWVRRVKGVATKYLASYSRMETHDRGTRRRTHSRNNPHRLPTAINDQHVIPEAVKTDLSIRVSGLSPDPAGTAGFCTPVC